MTQPRSSKEIASPRNSLNEKREAAALRELEFMMVTAMVDERLSREEMSFLRKHADDWGMGRDVFKQTLERALSDQRLPQLPATGGEALRLLSKMLQTMLVDGEVDDLERGLLIATAEAFGVCEEEWSCPPAGSINLHHEGIEKTAGYKELCRVADGIGRHAATCLPRLPRGPLSGASSNEANTEDAVFQDLQD